MKNLFEHIETNLLSYFPESDLKVISAYNRTGGEITESWEPVFKYLVLLTKDLQEKLFLVSNKNLFIHLSEHDAEKEYYTHNKQLSVNFQGLDFMQIKANKYNRLEIENLQLACELKTKKLITDISPVQFIKKHCGECYTDIYKMLLKLSKEQPLSGQIESRNMASYGCKPEYLLFLNVQSDNGKYSFPMQNFSDTCTDEEIIKLFVDLICPELLKNNHLTQKIAA